MSQLLIHQYLNGLQDLKKVSGTHRESVVREAFKDLLKNWGKTLDLVFIPEYEIETPAKDRRYVDGALLYELRVPFGYWEAKDEKDDLNAEIELKFKRGYPQDNIIFEDSREAVLFQNKKEVLRCPVDDVGRLQKLLNLFFAYQRPEIADFRKAVEQFKIDLPAVLKSLREMIEGAEKENSQFKKAANTFLNHAKDAINPSLTPADVREILIQHILTAEVFAAVFPGTPFHQDNNVARELHYLEETFFVGNTKFKTLKALEPYYAAIRSAAAQISNHHEKQTFLKVIYENFYKVYNIKAADRLGVVYTPNEIVRFMIEGADWLCEKHFGKNLIDSGVDILDPATGTGTFVCELLEHFRGQPKKLEQKYLHELHANEVAILPYYVANLNIEATYAAISGDYHEYPNLCFVDTLDNTFALRKRKGDHMGDLFGSVSEENVGRIRRQNARTISVVIGNPPYNANQLNENENNKNREYPEIDRRIKDTYIKKSTAQKTKVYDMYARFLRWASDRVDENGIVAFITNRSFIDSRTFDGFRKDVAGEFNEIWIMDLGGDVRVNPKLSGTKHNVFGIQTGVAISFLVKKAAKKGQKKKDHICKIFYDRRPEFETKDEKLSFLSNSKLSSLKIVEISPDKRGNWLNQTDNDFEDFIPLASKAAKKAKQPSQRKVIFQDFSLGISTNRDSWVINKSQSELLKRMEFFIEEYEKHRPDSKKYDTVIKWSRNLKRRLGQSRYEPLSQNLIRGFYYRPFCKNFLYDSSLFIDERGSADGFFGGENLSISFTGIGAGKPFHCLATNSIFSLDFLEKTQGVPFYIYDDEGNKTENITNWALEQFKMNYQKEDGKSINKKAVFEYCYAVLHDPIYREKYAINLKRDFPNIPFYKGFQQWADWGKELMDLHIGFEKANPYPLKRTDTKTSKTSVPKTKLKVDKNNGVIFIDEETSLTGVPAAVWQYKLGNRSALEWILDQYKESKPKDPTIRAKFDNYRFADYKEQVIELLMRVATVSIETIKIVEKMNKINR